MPNIPDALQNNFVPSRVSEVLSGNIKIRSAIFDKGPGMSSNEPTIVHMLNYLVGGDGEESWVNRLEQMDLGIAEFARILTCSINSIPDTWIQELKPFVPRIAQTTNDPEICTKTTLLLTSWAIQRIPVFHERIWSLMLPSENSIACNIRHIHDTVPPIINRSRAATGVAILRRLLRDIRQTNVTEAMAEATSLHIVDYLAMALRGAARKDKDPQTGEYSYGFYDAAQATGMAFNDVVMGPINTILGMRHDVPTPPMSARKEAGLAVREAWREALDVLDRMCMFHETQA